MNQVVSELMVFDDTFRAQLRDLFTWRRDVRRFRPDPLPVDTFERLIDGACRSRWVGASRPWRSVLVDDLTRPQPLRQECRTANADALKSQSGALPARHAELKLARTEEAPCQFAVSADRVTDAGHGL